MLKILVHAQDSWACTRILRMSKNLDFLNSLTVFATFVLLRCFDPRSIQEGQGGFQEHPKPFKQLFIFIE